MGGVSDFDHAEFKTRSPGSAVRWRLSIDGLAPEAAGNKGTIARLIH